MSKSPLLGSDAALTVSLYSLCDLLNDAIDFQFGAILNVDSLDENSVYWEMANAFSVFRDVVNNTLRRVEDSHWFCGPLWDADNYNSAVSYENVVFPVPEGCSVCLKTSDGQILDADSDIDTVLRTVVRASEFLRFKQLKDAEAAQEVEAC